MKKDFIVPIIVLAVICLFVSGALAIVNSITKPVISDANIERAYAAKKMIIPQAEEFIKLEIDNLRSEGKIPHSIREIFKTSNNTGFIFNISVRGYGHDDIKFLCGIDPDGKIIKTEVLAHSETQGLGTPIFEEPHAGKFWGKNLSGIEDIAAISGATITSDAFKNGISDALKAFEIVRSL